MTEIAAIIQYECLTLLARSIVCDRQMAREFAQCQPKTNAGLLKVQGPWIGQGADPVDLKGPTHVGKLMESLEPNYQIRHFLLGNNAVSTTGAKRVAEFIHKYPDRMETWYLAGCHITRHGLSLLVPQMTTSSIITNLWFKHNPFGPNSGSLLAELVLQTPNLHTLDLETTELGDEGARRFIDSITGQPSALRNLYLNANGIGQLACASIGKYLADPHCALESLFVSTNPIGDAGMHLLADGLAKKKTLK